MAREVGAGWFGALPEGERRDILRRLAAMIMQGRPGPAEVSAAIAGSGLRPTHTPGWQVRYEPAAVAWTEAPSTLRQLWRQRYRWSYGTMQVLWKHRYALREGGHAGRLGRYCLPYLALFQVLFPLLAPAVDVYGLYGLLFQPFGTVAAAWVGFTAVQMAVTAHTLRLDGESCTYLWAVPLQQVLYRQLSYLVVVQSLVMALTGARLRWHRMHRTGAAAAHAHAAHR